MLKENYTSYGNALSIMRLENLQDRRLMLCERFVKKCLEFEKSKNMFPLNEQYMSNIRINEKLKVNFARKDRLKENAIPTMQWLLNQK